MSARPHIIAKAVAAAINAATLPMAVVAQVSWMPLLDRSNIDTLACWVVPSTETPSSLSRRSTLFECEVMVGLHRAAANELEISDLAATLEAIGDELLHQPLTTDIGTAHYASMRIEPLMDIEAWNTRKQYLGVLRVTYRVSAAIKGAA